MSYARRLGAPASMPSLTEVQSDRTILAGLPVTVIVDLRRQVRHLAADLEAALSQAIIQPTTQEHRSETEPDRLLAPEIAAERFGVTKRWLLEHTDEIPGARRLSRKVIRFSERRLARFLNRTPV